MALIDLLTKFADRRNIVRKMLFGLAKEEEFDRKGGAKKTLAILEWLRNEFSEAIEDIRKWLKSRHKI